MCCRLRLQSLRVKVNFYWKWMLLIVSESLLRVCWYGWYGWVCENCNHSVRVSAWQQNTAWPTHTHRQRSREWILFSHNTFSILQNNVESISVVWIFETKCCDKMKKINFSETWNNLKSRFNWSPRLELPEWRWAKNFDWISRTHYEVKI